jgi:5-methylcytosine-specific restriction endonuclease McrA
MKSKKNGVSVFVTTGCRQRKKTAVRSARKAKPFNPHPYLVSAARRIWRWSDEKKTASELCAVGKDKRRCTTCREVFPRKLVHMDHIVPVGKQPREWADYPGYYERLFCPASNIQGLCKTCHKEKTIKDLKEMHK